MFTWDDTLYYMGRCAGKLIYTYSSWELWPSNVERLDK